MLITRQGIRLFRNDSTYLDGGDTAPFSPAGAYTMFARVKFITPVADNTIFSKWNTTTDRSFKLNLDYVNRRAEFQIFGANNIQYDCNTANNVFKLGQWHTVAGVFTGSGGVTQCFADGIGGATTAVAATTIKDSTVSALFGRRSEAASNLGVDGWMRDIAVWDAALTQQELLYLTQGASPLDIRRASLAGYWALGGNSQVGHSASYGALTTVGGGGLSGETEVIGTDLLDAPSIRIPGQITRGASRTLVADAARYDAMIIERKPVSYWPLDDPSGSYLDRTKTANHLSTTAGNTRARTVDYKPAFRGAEWANNEGASVGTPSMTVVDNLTMECWVKPITIGATQQMLMYNGSSGANGYGVIINTGGTISGLLGGVSIQTASTRTLPIGLWSHVVLKREATVWSYYINGYKDATAPGTGTPGTPSGGLTGPGAPVNFSRQMTRVAYYDRPLNDAEIFRSYQEGMYGYDTTLLVGGQSIMGAFVMASSVSSPAGVLS